MNLEKKEFVIKGLGIFFIVFGLLAMFNTLVLRDNYSGVFWICYIGMILIGVGALYRSSYLIATQLSLLTIPLIAWNIDFVSYLIRGKSLFGVVDYFFTEGFSFLTIISLEHLFIVPLGVYLLYLIKIDRKDFWKLGFVEVILLYLISILFTDPAVNINCAFESCFSFIGNYMFPIVWNILGFCFVLLTWMVLVNVRGLNK